MTLGDMKEYQVDGQPEYYRLNMGGVTGLARKDERSAGFMYKVVIDVKGNMLDGYCGECNERLLVSANADGIAALVAHDAKHLAY